MKNKFLLKLSAALCIGTTLFPLTANAYTYDDGELHGKDSRSKNIVLGDGIRYLYGNLLNDYSGEAELMRVEKWSPDSYIAYFTLWEEDEYGQDSFTANSTTSSGEQQSYYRRWSGHYAKSKAWTAVSD